MSEFTAKIKAMLDDGSLKSQFQKIENQKIDLKNVTVSKIELSSSALSALEKQLSNLKADVKFTFNGGKGGDVGKQISQQINSAMSSADKLKIGLDNRKFEADLGKINQGFVGLTTRSQALQKNVVDLNNAFKLMSNTNEGMDTRLHAFEMYQSLIPGVTSQISQLAAEEKKLAETAKLSSAKDSFLSKIDEQVRKLTPETEKFRQEFDKIKNEVGHVYDSNGLSKLEAEFKKVTNAVKEEEAAMKKAAQEQQTLMKSSTLSNNIETWMNKNKAAAEQFGAELRTLQSQLKGNVDAGSLKNVSLRFKEIKSEAAAAGLTTNSFVDSIKRIGLAAVGISGSYMMIRKVVDTFKQGIETIKELDDALIDLKKTTTMNGADLEAFYYGANESAKQYGSTTAEIIQSAADWSRLGFSDKQSATTMANLSSMMKTISPGMTMDTATTGLVSVMKAYGIEANEVLDGVMSKINIVGNTAATSNEQIIEGLERSSSSIAMMNSGLDKFTSLEQNIALFTAGQEITQDASKVGNAIRSKDWACA